MRGIFGACIRLDGRQVTTYTHTHIHAHTRTNTHTTTQTHTHTHTHWPFPSTQSRTRDTWARSQRIFRAARREEGGREEEGALVSRGESMLLPSDDSLLAAAAPSASMIGSGWGMTWTAITTAAGGSGRPANNMCGRTSCTIRDERDMQQQARTWRVVNGRGVRVRFCGCRAIAAIFRWLWLMDQMGPYGLPLFVVIVTHHLPYFVAHIGYRSSEIYCNLQTAAEFRFGEGTAEPLGQTSNPLRSCKSNGRKGKYNVSCNGQIIFHLDPPRVVLLWSLSLRHSFPPSAKCESILGCDGYCDAWNLFTVTDPTYG